MGRIIFVAICWLLQKIIVELLPKKIQLLAIFH